MLHKVRLVLLENHLISKNQGVFGDNIIRFKAPILFDNVTQD